MGSEEERGVGVCLWIGVDVFAVGFGVWWLNGLETAVVRGSGSGRLGRYGDCGSGSLVFSLFRVSELSSSVVVFLVVVGGTPSASCFSPGARRGDLNGLESVDAALSRRRRLTEGVSSAIACPLVLGNYNLAQVS
jgi:hypothetical protein